VYQKIMELCKHYKITWIPVSGSYEIRFECPRCQLAGRTSIDMKLYVNTSTGLFDCKRCEFRGGFHVLQSYYRYTKGEPAQVFRTERLPSFEDLGRDLEEVGDGMTAPIVFESLIPYGTMLAWESPEARLYLQEKRGLTKEQVEFSGLLYTPEGYFGRRVLVPICDSLGEYQTFVARAIDPHVDRKYLFPKGSHVSKLLYGGHFFTRYRSVIWLVEGVFDAIHCAPMALATFGKHISESQINLLRHLGPERIVLLWDWDAWAITPDLWQRAVERLREYFDVVEVKLPRVHTDPTDYPLYSLHRLIRDAS
jgi:hypothetical protein